MDNGVFVFQDSTTCSSCDIEKTTVQASINIFVQYSFFSGKVKEDDRKVVFWKQKEEKTDTIKALKVFLR